MDKYNFDLKGITININNKKIEFDCKFTDRNSVQIFYENFLITEIKFITLINHIIFSTGKSPIYDGMNKKFLCEINNYDSEMYKFSNIFFD